MRGTYDRETWLPLRHPDERGLFFDVGTRSRPSSYWGTCERHERWARTWSVEGKECALERRVKGNPFIYREKERTNDGAARLTNRSIVGGKTIRSLTARPGSSSPSHTHGFPTHAFTHPPRSRSRWTREVGSTSLEFITRSEETDRGDLYKKRKRKKERELLYSDERILLSKKNIIFGNNVCRWSFMHNIIKEWAAFIYKIFLN